MKLKIPETNEPDFKHKVDNLLHTTLKDEQIVSSFVEEYFYIKTIYLSKLSALVNVETDDDKGKQEKRAALYLISSLEPASADHTLLEGIMQLMFEYLIYFDIYLTNIDLLKIISKIQRIILYSIDDEENSQDIDSFKDALIRVTYMATLETYEDCLRNIASRELDTNNFKKLEKIIRMDKAKEILPERTLYYIYRNAFDVKNVDNVGSII